MAFTAVAGAGGWFYAQRDTEKEVRRLMIDANLVDKISYEHVSYNPITGKVAVHDIRAVHAIPGKMKLDTFEIIDWDVEDDIYTRLHVRAVGLHVDLPEVAREESEKGPPVLASW